MCSHDGHLACTREARWGPRRNVDWARSESAGEAGQAPCGGGKPRPYFLGPSPIRHSSGVAGELACPPGR